MSREIKFRAWTFGREPHMVDVKCICWNDDGSIERIETDFRIYDKDDEYVLVQNTGTLDDNDIEIYEGDIVHVKEQVHGGTRDEENNFDEYVCVVAYDPRECAYLLMNSLGQAENYLSNLNFWLRLGEADVTVIGNIYENPELLKEAMK